MTKTTQPDSTSASVAAVDARGGVAVAGTGFRARRIAFSVVAWATSLMVVVLFVFGLMEVVFMWLPDATVVSRFDDITAADLVHRGHLNSVGIVAWAVVLAVLVQLRQPHKRVAAMLLAVAIVLAGTVDRPAIGPTSLGAERAAA